MNKYSANIVDVLNEEIYPGTITVENGRIKEIKRDSKEYDTFILPGFVDSHIHIESSMLPPSEFARVAVAHGTVGCVSDPHEIANVLGIEGVRYMIEDGKTIPFHFSFSAPSCVPATNIETSGAKLSAKDIEKLIVENKVSYLGEMMNFPGVINESPDVLEKVKIAQKHNVLIDGHAPGLSGKDLEKYIKTGISTDHECFTKQEAIEKLGLGMKILIREGSAAKNFKELIPLAENNWNNMMFCSDDKHPDDLEKNHVDKLVKKSIANGISRMHTLKMACVNPVLHYGLDIGLLQVGDSADFIEVTDLNYFDIIKTVIKGEVVAENAVTKLKYKPSKPINNFNVTKKNAKDFFVEDKGLPIRVIKAFNQQLITEKEIVYLKGIDGNLISDTSQDVLKMTVVNRYFDTNPGLAFIKGFGLKKGAIASSIAHDSHNIISIGVSDAEIAKAVNLVIENKGGITYVNSDNNIEEVLPMPIAGLMSNLPYNVVSKKYDDLDILTKIYGSTLNSPFMSLSFMALLVIPSLKLSDKGLFDGERFELIDLYEQ